MKTFSYVKDMPNLAQLSVEEVDGKRFYISPNNKRLPSVTTVLGHFKKQSLIDWRERVGEEEANKIMNRASTRGTKFHNMMERYLKNQIAINEDIMPDMKQSFFNSKPTIDLIDNIQYIESPLWSERLGLAGRTDVIGDFDGVPSIIDFKTSLKPKKEKWIDGYFEQGTAYSLMYKERVGISINQVVIIIAVDNESEPQLFVKNTSDYVDSLIKKIWLYKKDQKNVC